MKQPSTFPPPLALAMEAFHAEDQPFRSVHRLIDLVEVYTKLHTVLLVSEAFESEAFSDEMRGMLAAGLRTPSLGIWWMFAREFAKRLPLQEKAPLMAGLGRACSKKGTLWSLMEGNDNLLAFRNAYAHGATPSDDQCRKDLDTMEPRVMKVLENSGYLRGIQLLGPTGGDPQAEKVQEGVSDGRCYLVREDGLLDLHPLLLYRPEAKRFFFYNDLKNTSAGFLNYEAALHHRDKELREEFLVRFPLKEWSGSAPDDFVDQVERLTESFKGRQKELTELLEFCQQGQGFCMVWGGPGIGKSALLARLTQILHWPTELRQSEGWSEEAGAGILHVVEYFFRRGQGSAALEFCFDNLNLRLDRVCKTGLSIGNSVEEKARLLEQRLKVVAEKLPEGERLLLVLDGLDEAEQLSTLMRHLPKQLPDNILMLYAGRERPDIRQHLYLNLDRERRREKNLSGLSAGDIRALLVEVVSKYELSADYVEEVTTISEGNPLYVKLLCQELAEQQIQVNRIDQLPRKMEELYEQILNRVTQVEGAGDLLRLLAQAKGDFTAEMMAECLETSLDRVRTRILPAVRELLMENTLTEDVDDFQLFHESLRGHLQRTCPGACLDWDRKLYAWCRDAENANGSAGVYRMRYFAAHARDVIHQEKDPVEVMKSVCERLDREDYRQQSYLALGNTQGLQSLSLLILEQLCILPTEEDRRTRGVTELIRYHREPRERYQEGLSRMDQGPAGDDLVALAEAGDTPKQKVLLVLRGLNAGTDTSPLLTQKTRQWLEEAADPVLHRLIETVNGGRG